jgi:hypothetical protein
MHPAHKIYLFVPYDPHKNDDFFLNNINQLISVMVKCGVLFEVRTGFLNNI